MENCSRCDELPDAVPQSGTLYLHAGLQHTTSKIRKIFEQAGLSCRTDEDRMIRVPYQLEELSAALEQVQDELIAVLFLIMVRCIAIHFSEARDVCLMLSI